MPLHNVTHLSLSRKHNNPVSCCFTVIYSHCIAVSTGVFSILLYIHDYKSTRHTYI